MLLKRLPTTQHYAAMVTKEDFDAFLTAKVADVISDNSYKRFLLKSRENQENWAVQTLSSIAKVQMKMKTLHNTIAELESQGLTRIYRLTQEITQCTVPPTKTVASWNVCAITGIRSDRCVEISRSNKSECRICVHYSFMKFTQLLWFLLRLENIIRVETKVWMQTQDVDESMQFLITKFQEREAWYKDMWDTFNLAFSHCSESFKHAMSISGR